MAAQPELVAPDRYAEFMNPAMRRLGGHYGCLGSIRSDGKMVSKGTATLVEIAGKRLVLTARHVVAAESMRTNPVALLLPPLGRDGAHEFGVERMPRMYELPLDRMLWESQELDVAVIEPTDAVAAAEEARFFDGLRHAATTKRLRERWRTYSGENTSLPYLICGFPNFGHLIDDVEKVERIGAIPVPAYVTQFENSSWDGLGRAPQIMLEIDAVNPAHVPEGLAQRAQQYMAQLFASSVDAPDPFAGYSGGPLVVVGRDGEHLLGLIHEGGRIFGDAARAAASAWDDVVNAFTRSDAWRRMAAG